MERLVAVGQSRFTLFATVCFVAMMNVVGQSERTNISCIEESGQLHHVPDPASFDFPETLQLLQRRAGFKLEQHQQDDVHYKFHRQRGQQEELSLPSRKGRMLPTSARLDFQVCSRLGVLHSTWAPFHDSSRLDLLHKHDNMHLHASRRPTNLAQTLATAALDLANTTRGDISAQFQHWPTFLKQVISNMAHTPADAGVTALATGVWALSCGMLLCYVLYAAFLATRPIGRSDTDSRLQPEPNTAADDDSELSKGLLGEVWSIGICRWMSLCWMDKLIGSTHLASKRTVANGCQVECDALRSAWATEVKDRGLLKASMLKAVLKSIGTRRCCQLVLFAWAATFLELVGMVMALDTVLATLEGEGSSTNSQTREQSLQVAMLAISLLFFVPIAYRCLSIIVTMIDGQLACMVTTGISSLLHEKVLRLPVGASYYGLSLTGESGTEPADRVVAKMLAASLAQEWPQIFKVLALFSAAPLVAGALVILLARHLGFAGLLGALYLVPGYLVSVAIVRWAVNWRSQYQSFQNSRLRRFTELVKHLASLRALGHDSSFVQRIQGMRQAELGANQAYSVTVGMLVANLHSMTWLVALGGLTFNIILDGDVEARDMWVVLQVIASLHSCANIVASGLRRAMSVSSSLTRVECFLKQPERPEGIVRSPAAQAGVSILGSFAFEESAPPALRDINLEISQGELVAVIGSAGSGKTALLQSVLGELFPCGLSQVAAPQQVSYCAQQPWIVPGTVRQNVMFPGFQASKHRYEEALAAASFLPDLAKLPGGDEALVEETTLTASQAHRLALARVAYGNADLLLIDDALGALQRGEAEAILDKFLLAPHVHRRTRLIAISRPSTTFLQKFDRVVVLQRGCIMAQGRPENVLASGQQFQECWHQLSMREMKEAATPPSKVTGEMQKLALSVCNNRLDDSNESTGKGSNENILSDSEQAPESQATHSLSVLRDALLSAQEEECSKKTSSTMHHGKTATAPVLSSELRKNDIDDLAVWHVLSTWLQAGGYGNLAVAMILLIGQRAVQLWQMLCLAWWGDSAMQFGCDHWWFAVRLLLAVLLNSILLVAVEWASSRFARCSSKEVHDSALASIIKSRLHRRRDRAIEALSTDLAQVDSAMVSILLTGMRSATGSLLQQAYVLSLVPTWLALGVLAPLYVCVCYFGFLYQQASAVVACSSRELLSSTQLLMDQALQDHVSVRASGGTKLCLEQLTNSVASAMKVSCLISAASKSWVCLRATLCLSLAATACALQMLLSDRSAQIGVGTLGLVVSLLFAFLADFESLCDNFSQAALVISALRRITDIGDSPMPAASPGMADTGSQQQLSFPVLVHEEDLVPLQLQSPFDSPTIVCDRDGIRLLQSVAGNCALQTFSAPADAQSSNDRQLWQLAPSSAALRLALKGTEIDCERCDGDSESSRDFCIVGVNNVFYDAQAIAEVLVHASDQRSRAPAEGLLLELRHKSCIPGVSVCIKNLYANYGERAPFVLKDYSFDAPQGSHVAIIGPPASGKSTVLSCILGLLELQAGRVLVGGRDVCSLSTSELRSLVGLVPQEPAIWEGTWRENIDPESKFTDERIWDVLVSVGLADFVQARPEGLSAHVAEGGENLSLGQKHLLNFARMALRRPPLLLLDDCFAMLDPLAQQTVRAMLQSSFTMSTVIAVTSSKEAALALGFESQVNLLT